MSTSDALIPVCEACTKPVENGDGYLWVDLGEAQDAERSQREWRGRQAGPMTIDVLLTLPGPARWHVHHNACDPDPDAVAYAIELERVETTNDLLTWTAHLMQKNWVASTDWLALIETTAKGTGDRFRLATGANS